jgi:hypothetical protein
MGSGSHPSRLVSRALPLIAFLVDKHACTAPCQLARGAGALLGVSF